VPSLDGLVDGSHPNRSFGFGQDLGDEPSDMAAASPKWLALRWCHTGRRNPLQLLSQPLQPRGYLWVRQSPNQSDYQVLI
jgi:hypothetical protein